jgi:hypothetical protein
MQKKETSPKPAANNAKVNAKKPAAPGPEDVAKEPAAESPDETSAQANGVKPKRKFRVRIVLAVVGVSLMAVVAWVFLSPTPPATAFDRQVRDLLNQKVVQKELKVTDDQMEKVAKIEELRRRPWTNRELQDLSELDKARLQVQRNQEAMKSMARVLNKAQRERLHQIYVQLHGKRIWQEDKEVATELKLTAQQKQQMVDLEKERRQALDPRTAGGKGGNDQKGKQNRVDPRLYEKKMLEVLSPAQQSKWDSMQGEKFAGLNELRRSLFLANRNKGQ